MRDGAFFTLAIATLERAVKDARRGDAAARDWLERGGGRRLGRLLAGAMGDALAYDAVLEWMVADNETGGQTGRTHLRGAD